MLQYKEFNKDIICLKSSSISYSKMNCIYPEFKDRDLRIVRLDFEGDIAQFIVKNESFLIKLYPIASIVLNEDTFKLIILNTDNFEVDEYCNYLTANKSRIKSLNIISYIENLLSYHSDKLDSKIKNISNQISIYNLDNIKSSDLVKISKIFHNLLLLKNQYQEIQQTLTQINSLPSDKLKIVKEINNLEDFSRTINIYQNQFEEDVKNLNRMVKEIEILLQMTDIKFADRRNRIAITSLNLDIVILVVSFISMFGSIFGMNLNSAVEDLSYGLYFVMILILFLTLIFYNLIKVFLIKSSF